MINLSSLIEYDRLAREDGKKYSRKRTFFAEVLKSPGKHFVGIVGPRGVGKTIILKQLANQEPNTFYLALDTFEENIFEVVQKITRELSVKTFLLDEVHVHSDFEESLKKIYDFLDVQVIFTSSMALALYKSAYDLSRRVILKTLYPFSLREYLLFKHGLSFPSLDLKSLVEKKWDPKIMAAADFFNDYLEGGILPFALVEPVPLELLKNILMTIVRKDIPRVARLTTDELDLIEKMIKFIGYSAVDGINYTSLSQNLGITKYKAEQYVELCQQAFIVQRVMPRGTNVLKEPKILLTVPYRLLYTSYESALGGLREDFFVEAMRYLGKDIHYLKSTRGQKTPDYLLDDFYGQELVFEIGGKSKGRTQFKGIKVDKKIVLSHSVETTGIKRPLFLVGMIDS
jgi:uncharacterized protein